MNEIKKITDLYKGYFKYDKNEYEDIWNNSTVVVDTNILLNFYRYSKETKDTILSTLKSNQKRLWLPECIVEEYFSNRDNVMNEAYKIYDILLEKNENSCKELLNELNKYKDKQLICKRKIKENIEKMKKEIKDIIEKEKKTKKPNYELNKIEKEIFDLFNGECEKVIEEDELKNIIEEGKKRMENNIPPGYKDKGKERNGDYIIYASIIEKSKKEKCNIIFITDDGKEDWFNFIKGERHGGRYELLNEFYKKTGNLLLILSSDDFITEYSEKTGKEKPSSDVIRELRTIRSISAQEENNIDNNIISKLYVLKNLLMEEKNEIGKDTIIEFLYNILQNSNVPKRYYMEIEYEISKLSEIFEYCDREEVAKRTFNTINNIIKIVSYLLNPKIIPTNKLTYYKQEYKKVLVEIQSTNDINKIKNILRYLEEIITDHINTFNIKDFKLRRTQLIPLINMQMNVHNAILNKYFSDAMLNQIVSGMQNIILSMNNTIMANNM